MDSVKALLTKINHLILNPLIALMFAVALLYFLFGVFQYIAGAADAKKREVGQLHMLWGFIGLLIMVAVFSIIRIIANTLGVPDPLV